MRKADIEVREVVCSETGKPITKIPLWMADIKVKFLSDEARQKHTSAMSLPVDMDKPRRIAAKEEEVDDLKGLALPADDDEPVVYEEEELESEVDADDTEDDLEV